MRLLEDWLPDLKPCRGDASALLRDGCEKVCACMELGSSREEVQSLVALMAACDSVLARYPRGLVQEEAMRARMQLRIAAGERPRKRANAKHTCVGCRWYGKVYSTACVRCFKGTNYEEKEVLG